MQRPPTNPLLRFSTPDPAPFATDSSLTVYSSGGYAGHAFPIHRYQRADGSWRFVGWAMRGASWWRPRTARDDAPARQRLTHVGRASWPGGASAWTEDDYWAPELHRVRGHAGPRCGNTDPCTLTLCSSRIPPYWCP